MVGLNQIRASVLALIILSVFGYVYMYIQDTTLDLKGNLSYQYANPCLNLPLTGACAGADNTSLTLTGVPTDVTANDGNIAKLVFVLGALGVAIAMVFAFLKK